MRSHRLSDHDALTGLLARKPFQLRLEDALAHAKSVGGQVALVHVDLDRFRVINGSLGHDAGDDLLRAVSERLGSCVGDGAMVARLGGDEFVVLLADVGSREAIAVAVERLRIGLGGAFVIAEQEIFVTSSLGVAVFPDDATTPTELFANADKAVERAKHVGRDNMQFFTRDMKSRDQSGLVLERDLRRALERREFLLHYQPQIDTKTGEVLGVEALVRWMRPGKGMVPPLDFIPLLEETGLIVPVGAWVLQTACEQVEAWRSEGIDPLRVAVNISASQLRQSGLVETVERVLRETHLGPGALELELTEGMLIENNQACNDGLHRIREMGVAISLDDFGTGYSSLSYLKRLPIDTLKIDRAFVRDVLSDPADRAIAAAIVDLAHALGLHVVAEGIETEEQLAFMRKLACDGAQGYLIGRPMAAEACGTWIRTTRARLIRESGTQESAPPSIRAPRVRAVS